MATQVVDFGTHTMDLPIYLLRVPFRLIKQKRSSRLRHPGSLHFDQCTKEAYNWPSQSVVLYHILTSLVTPVFSHTSTSIVGVNLSQTVCRDPIWWHI